jgi:hypothetical protein
MRIWKGLAVLALATGLSVPVAGTALAADDENCALFSSQADAQAALATNPTSLGGLDSDKDGVACEDYAYAAASTTSPSSPSPSPSTPTSPSSPAGSGGSGGSSGQIGTPPAGGVATGDGSTADTGPGSLPFVVGGLGLAAAGAAAMAARRSARGSA